MFIKDLDVFHAGELFHRGSQRLRNAVRGPIGLAIAGQINAECPICDLDPSVVIKPVPDCYQSAALLCQVRTFEVFVHGGREGISCRGNLT